MTSLTNSEGLVSHYTNELLDTMLLQLNASNTYYTTGRKAAARVPIAGFMQVR